MPDGTWLGELQIADQRGKATLERDATTARAWIGELDDYIVLLRDASPAVSGFTAPVSAGRIENDGALFGFLPSQAGLGSVRIGLAGPSGEPLWHQSVSIRPAKFRDTIEFETMVSEICDWRTALTLDLRASSSAPWTLDRNLVAIPAEERLAVLRAAAGETAFVEALRHIENNATSKLERETTLVRLGESGIDTHSLGQHLSSAVRRRAVPSSHRLGSRLSAIPTEMPSVRRYDSTDTPDNRFAKFVGEGFRRRIVEAIGGGIDLRTPLGAWGMRTASMLDRILGSRFYRGVGNLTRLELGSPGLQRRRGYRKVLEAFLAGQAGLAVKWDDLDALVHAETRDVPSLYEIWCLVRLRDEIEKTYGIALSQDHISLSLGRLKLRRGTAATASNLVKIADQPFAMKLWYNRSFSPAPSPAVNGFWKTSPLSTGTWTKTMMPDFTIELRPKDGPGELLVHLDAKYKLKSIRNSQNPPPDRTHKADDVDKMHAYLFGINNSVGAYILYPGDTTSYFRRSDLRSTIGAIPVVPGESQNLGDCLKEILEAAVRDA